MCIGRCKHYNNIENDNDYVTTTERKWGAWIVNDMILHVRWRLKYHNNIHIDIKNDYITTIESMSLHFRPILNIIFI